MMSLVILVQFILMIVLGELVICIIIFMIDVGVFEGVIVNNVEIVVVFNVMSMWDMDFILFNGIDNGEDDMDSVVLEVGGEVENFDFEFNKFVNFFLIFGFYEFGDQVMYIIIVENIGFFEVIGV